MKLVEAMDASVWGMAAQLDTGDDVMVTRVAQHPSLLAGDFVQVFRPNDVHVQPKLVHWMCIEAEGLAGDDWVPVENLKLKYSVPEDLDVEPDDLRKGLTADGKGPTD